MLSTGLCPGGHHGRAEPVGETGPSFLQRRLWGRVPPGGEGSQPAPARPRGHTGGRRGGAGEEGLPGHCRCFLGGAVSCCPCSPLAGSGPEKLGTGWRCLVVSVFPLGWPWSREVGNCKKSWLQAPPGGAARDEGALPQHGALPPARRALGAALEGGSWYSDMSPKQRPRRLCRDVGGWGEDSASRTPLVVTAHGQPRGLAACIRRGLSLRRSRGACHRPFDPSRDGAVCPRDLTALPAGRG